MTIDEAKKIAAIVATADGGCSECVKDLCLRLNEAFPEFVWEMVGFQEVEVKLK